MYLFTKFFTPKCYDGILRAEPVSQKPSVCDPSGMIDLKSQIKMLLQSGQALDDYRRSHYPKDFDFPNGEVDEEAAENSGFPADSHDQLVSDVASEVLRVLHAHSVAKRKQPEAPAPSVASEALKTAPDHQEDAKTANDTPKQ